MKIVHICQYYNDGFGYQENLLPRYQAKLGNDVMVITSDRMSYFSGKRVPKIIGTGEFEDNGIRILRLPIRGEFKGRFVRFSNLFETLEREKPDYIFHHGLTMPSLITVAKYKRKNPEILLAADNHGDYHNSSKYSIYRFLYYRGIWKCKIQDIIDNVNIFFSVTPGSKLFAEKELGIPTEKHHLLYLGADVENNFFSPKLRAKVRKSLCFDEKDFVLITAGKINSKKKTDIIIRALKKINSESIKLMIIGTIEDSYNRKLDKLIKGDSRIIKIGWVKANELNKYFSAADIAVFPGSQSAIWQQAISCKLPIILKYWPGSDYLIDSNGFFLFSGNSLELKQLLELLKDNPILLNKMRFKAEKLLKSVISYNVIARRTISPVIKE